MTSDRSRKLWIYLLLAVGLLISGDVVVRQYAPRFAPDLARITIGSGHASVTVPGQRLACTPRSPGIWADCRVPFEGAELQVIVLGSDTTLSGCRATYGGTPVGCQTGFVYTPDLKPMALIRDPLDVPAARLAMLRQRNPWSHMGEERWVLLVLVVNAVVARLAMLLLRQVRPTWPQAVGVGIGVGLFLFLGRTMLRALLRLGFVD